MAFRDMWIEKRENDQSSANGNRNMSQMQDHPSYVVPTTKKKFNHFAISERKGRRP